MNLKEKFICLLSLLWMFCGGLFYFFVFCAPAWISYFFSYSLTGVSFVGVLSKSLDTFTIMVISISCILGSNKSREDSKLPKM